MARPAVLRVVEREVLVYRRLWKGSVGFVFVIPVLFLAAMGFGVGDLVDERTGLVAGVSYLVFVTPGLVAANAMQSAAGESLWPVMAGIKWVGSYRAMVATPLAPADVFTGTLVWTTLRSGLGAAAFLAVAALVGAVPAATGVLAVPAAMLCAAAFAAPLAAFAASQETDVRFPVVMRFVVLPLFLFSGTFFPVEQLPGALRAVAAVSPLWHGVELCRAATTGSLERGAALLVDVAVLAAVVLAGWRWGCRTFERKLAP